MNATPHEQQLLLDLQAQDTEIRKIRNQAANLEETQKLESIIAQRKVIVVERRKLERRTEELTAANTELDTKITSLKTKLGGIDLSLKAPGVTPKEVTALVKQQESLTGQVNSLEEESMALLAKMEEVEKNDAILASNDERLTSTGLDLKNRRDDKLAHLKKRMGSAVNKRKIALSSLPAPLVEKYDDFAKEAQGTVVVRYVNNHIEGVHTELSTVALRAVELGTPEEVTVLEDYGVMVVRV